MPGKRNCNKHRGKFKKRKSPGLLKRTVCVGGVSRKRSTCGTTIEQIDVQGVSNK